MADDKKDSKQNDFTNVNAPELKLKQSREDFDCKAKKIKLDEKKIELHFIFIILYMNTIFLIREYYNIMA